jgi:hypothetical protein
LKLKNNDIVDDLSASQIIEYFVIESNGVKSGEDVVIFELLRG